MDIRERFKQQVVKKKWWQKDDEVLVAVSAGVDSVVLLHLLHTLPKELKPKLRVAHVNHQLRSVSEKEAKFVEELCRDLDIPCYQSIWQEGIAIKQNVELAAREHRYSFFSKVMEEEKISILLTAHHQDDQIETMMMRLLTGGRLASLVSIEEERPFSMGQLIRPLLETEKKELCDYAKEHSILFYEDETNQEVMYLRNRLRHELLPQMKVENPKLNEQLESIRKELSYALGMVEEVILPLYEESVHFFEERCQIDISLYRSYSLNEQHFLLTKIVDECQQRFQLIIGKKQQELIHQLLLDDLPNAKQILKGNWYFLREYNKAEISRKGISVFQVDQTKLSLNEGVFLSESEWLGFFKKEDIKIPLQMKNWQQKDWLIQLENNTDLLVRKRRPGDRFIMDQTGKRKKVSRYFIDQKIPQEERVRSWIVEDNLGAIKCLVPFRESYLSIRDETDKIHYKLVYLYKKDK